MSRFWIVLLLAAVALMWLVASRPTPRGDPDQPAPAKKKMGGRKGQPEPATEPAMP